ncbi:MULTISPECIES: transglycosylase domain-containing protein [unclassified Anaeromyxobacter]|uniref:transglycosylase domain-containing protein n=1 Tax=unclassified Anaeromyxobacter TaxID=2620896 RepID=UPI001F5815B0|nr:MULTISPECIES: biosynthetic peptidoglycan transglycosylase [unclassified Anaeromyxobacter]
MRPSPARPPVWVRRALLAALAALLALYATVQGVVRLPAVDRWLRERIGAELRARLGTEVTVAPGVAIDPLFRATFGPVTLPGASPREPLVRIERIAARPSLLGLLRGRLEPASIALSGVRVSVGPRGRALRALLERRQRPGTAEPAPPAAPRPRPSARSALPSVHVRGLVVVLPLERGQVELGPVDAELGGARDAAGASFTLALRLPGGGTGQVTAQTTADDRWRAHVRLGHLSPALLPPALRAGPATLSDGAVALELDAESDEGFSHVEARLRASGERLFASGERVGDEPLGPFRLGAEGTVTWDAAERRVAFRDGVLSLGADLRVGVTAEARLGSGVPFTASLHADRADWTAFVEALPPGLAPPPEAPRARGTFDAHLDVSGPLLAPAAWTVGAGLDLTRMREASRKGEPVALRRPFPYQPVNGEGERARAFEIGPRTPTFVPIADLPEHVIRAVTTSEDGGFFGHPGFDFAELADAFARGAEEGRVVRGGSTITQQLAKNLYLSREKTLARKIREAAITVALEATVPKARLLEIYLNLVEWGPGVYGIGAAAQHWFGKDARALTAKEAAFLASIIPNPIRYHGMRARGSPSDAWEQRVEDILHKMTEQGALSDEDLLRALSEPIVFREG